MRLIRLVVLSICLGGAVVSPSEAASKLLSSIDVSAVFSGPYTGGEPISQQFFVLTYQTSGLILPATGGIYAGIPFQGSGSFPFTYCVGCSNALPLGWTGTVDLAGGAGYSQFLSDLHDGVNDGSLWQLAVFARGDGTVATAVGSVRDEYDWFAPNTAIDQWQVDYVRLVVLQNDVSFNNDSALADVRYQAHWEFWGTDGTEVIPFIFRGFFSPVDNDPVVNGVKAGAAVPVKFSLGGNQGLNIFQVGFPASQPVACDNFATLSSVEETVSAGQSGLTYDASTDQYTYVWKTEKSWAHTCRQLVLRLADGSFHIADFQFGK